MDPTLAAEIAAATVAAVGVLKFLIPADKPPNLDGKGGWTHHADAVRLLAVSVAVGLSAAAVRTGHAHDYFQTMLEGLLTGAGTTFGVNIVQTSSTRGGPPPPSLTSTKPN